MLFFLSRPTYLESLKVKCKSLCKSNPFSCGQCYTLRFAIQGISPSRSYSSTDKLIVAMVSNDLISRLRLLGYHPLSMATQKVKPHVTWTSYFFFEKNNNNTSSIFQLTFISLAKQLNYEK